MEYVHKLVMNKNIKCGTLIGTLVIFLFTVLFCCHLIANAMTILILSSLHTSLYNIFHKKELK